MLLLALSFIITLFHALLDAIKIEKGEYIHHSTRAAIWGAICASVSIVIALCFGYDLKYVLGAIIASVIVRTAFYDIILNTLRGKYFLYISEFTGSKIDLFYQRVGINQNYIRGIALFLCITILAYCIKNNIY